MPDITDDEFDEYNSLKSLYYNDKFQMIQDSLNSIKTLKDDIDMPIRKCVAMFALLQCEPLFSCCGFNYVGQPLHKCHQIGELYFLFRNKNKVLPIFYAMPLWGYETLSRPDSIALILRFSNVNPRWRSPICIHKPEDVVQYIRHLEDYLLLLSNEFCDEIILKDTNEEWRKNNHHWQYPAKADWVIRKEDVLNGLV